MKLLHSERLVDNGFSLLHDASQCANSVSAPQASGNHPQGAARRSITGREYRTTQGIPRSAPERPGASFPWPIDFHHVKYILEIYI